MDVDNHLRGQLADERQLEVRSSSPAHSATDESNPSKSCPPTKSSSGAGASQGPAPPVGEEAQAGGLQHDSPPVSTSTSGSMSETDDREHGRPPQDPRATETHTQEASLGITKTKAPFLQRSSSQRLRRQEEKMRDTHHDGGPTEEQMLDIVAPWEMILCECSPPGPVLPRLVPGERVYRCYECPKPRGYQC